MQYSIDRAKKDTIIGVVSAFSILYQGKDQRERISS